MYRKIEDSLFEIHTPMLDDPRITIKSFVIRDERHPLIIDTGYNDPGCRRIFVEALGKLEIDLSRARLVLTHLHPDHSGLAVDLERKGTTVYFGRKESRYFERLNSPGYGRFVELKYRMYGLQWDTVTPEDYPSLKYRTLNNFSYRTLNPGERLNADNYALEILALPGHTPGHLGLYDEKQNRLFSGDHVLEKITPNVDYWDSEFRVIRSYRKTLKAMMELNPALTLTAHGDNLKDLREPAQTILDRQDTRIAEILQLVRGGHETVRSIASHMGWVRKFGGWDNFPPKHKWMACNQIMAFVSYMSETKLLCREMRNGVLFFTAPE
jgi:glyoxylase-like metal-dependent hydrolase (beta-lactamase superfamily II)